MLIDLILSCYVQQLENNKHFCERRKKNRQITHAHVKKEFVVFVLKKKTLHDLTTFLNVILQKIVSDH